MNCSQPVAGVLKYHHAAVLTSVRHATAPRGLRLARSLLPVCRENGNQIAAAGPSGPSQRQRYGGYLLDRTSAGISPPIWTLQIPITCQRRCRREIQPAVAKPMSEDGHIQCTIRRIGKKLHFCKRHEPFVVRPHTFLLFRHSVDTRTSCCGTSYARTSMSNHNLTTAQGRQRTLHCNIVHTTPLQQRTYPPA